MYVISLICQMHVRIANYDDPDSGAVWIRSSQFVINFAS